MRKNTVNNAFREWKVFRFLIMMKLVWIIVLASALQTFATESYSQTTKIALSLKDASLEEVIWTIRKQAQFTFFYESEDIKNVQGLTVKAKNQTVDAILEECLQNTGLSYEIVHKAVIIHKSNETAGSVYPDLLDNQQPDSKKTISGKVTDSAGLPLPGVTVLVPGTTTGIVTDAKGEFSINVPSATKSLQFSFVGMKTIEMAITDVAKVVLHEDQEQLDEVVITGYSTTDRKMFTGSSDHLTLKDIQLAGIPDISKALEGNSAGVAVQNVSGTFGASPIITIRGSSSINGTNKPLWVIDGVVQEDLINMSADDLTSGNLSSVLTSGVTGINQEDIESIQILKDVSATAIYGAQAMNGVIVITTKRGKTGAPRINYSVSTTMRERPRVTDFDILNSGEEIQIYREYLRKGSFPITILRTNENWGTLGKMYEGIINNSLPLTQETTLNEDYLEYYANTNTDWFSVLFDNSFTVQHSLSIGGGSEKANYYASLAYYKDYGATEVDGVNNYIASLNTDFILSDKLRAGIILNGNYRDQRVPGTKDREFDPLTGQYNRDFDINPFSYALNTSRSMTPYDEDGDLQYYQSNFAPFNVLHELKHNFVDIGVTDLSIKTNLDYDIRKNLSAKFVLSGRWANTLMEYKIHESSNAAEAYRAGTQHGVSGEIESIRDANRFLMKDVTDPNVDPYSILPEGGFYNTSENTLVNYNFRALVEWSPTINELSRANILAGSEVKYTDREGRRNEGYGILYDRGGIVNTHPDVIKYLNNNGLKYFSYSEFRDRFLGYFIDAKYAYNEKYVAGGTFRYDGSNRLGNTPKARWLPSWNVSGAWNMQEEPFMQKVAFVNLLKLKATYGLSGTMGPDASAVLSLYAGTPLRPIDSDTETGIYIGDLENRDLTWEKLHELNLGFELRMFKNKVYTEFNYYKRKSTDLIDYITTSGIGGIGIKYGNIGTMKSDGVELTLRTNTLTYKNFKWTTQLTYNFHRSEITELDAHSTFANAVVGTGVAQLGRPHRALYSTRFAGLDSNGIPTFYDKDKQVVYDINLQQRDNMEDWLVYEGPVAPKGQGGLRNDLTYKNWSLGVNIIYKYGNKIRLQDLYPTNVNGLEIYDYRSFSKDVANRWVLPGDEYVTNVPALLDTKTIELLDGQNAYSLYNVSDQRVADGDFIRLKDISIAYVFPKLWVASSVRLALNVNNVALLYSDSSLNGVDPEFYNAGGVALPNQRTYSFTLNLNF